MKSLGQRIIAVLIVILILLQMLTVGISRYNSLRENAPADGKDVSLTIWYTDAKLSEFIVDSARTYEETTGIPVNVQLISAVDYIEKISEATLVNEQGPDLFVAGSDLLQKALYAGLVDDQVTYSEAEADNIPQKAFDAATCDGKLIGYPFYFESCFLLYNKYYTQDWPGTIDQILEYADSFESSTTTERVQSIFKWDVSDIFYNYWIVGNYMIVGGDPGDDESNININNEEAIQCLEVYKALNQFFFIESDTVTFDSVVEDFINGKVVFTIATTDVIEKLEQAKAEGTLAYDYGIATLPAVSSTLESRSLSVTSAVVVNGYSRQKELANEFAAYLVTQRSEDFYERTGRLSANLKAEAENEAVKTFMAEYADSVSLPKMMATSNFWIQLEVLFSKVWNGSDVAELVQELSDQIQAQIQAIE